MKIGDVSRRRRLADPARMRWYAHHRAVRFSRRMLGRDCLGGAHPLAGSGPVVSMHANG